jgi:ubiquinone/menaquinone biosynthesis C-methylase UbiE
VTAPDSIEPPGIFSRLYAASYDRIQARGEKDIFAELRADLLRRAEGRVLEMSTGTGANFPHYPPDRELQIVAVEPDGGMLSRAVRRADELGLEVEFHQDGAYPLAFQSDSFDTAVYCLCLCTIPDPKRALAEAVRVLRPGGQLLFLEHVRARDPGLARWQDRLHGPWKFIGRGCNCNRDTRAVIEASGLELEEIEERLEVQIPVPIVRPRISGVARKTPGPRSPDPAPGPPLTRPG